FAYHRVSSTSEAVKLKSKSEDARYLAGGQSMVQAMKLRLASPSDLIDLSSLPELRKLCVADDTVTVGAMVRHAEVASSVPLGKQIPALAALAGMIGDRQVRHMGTIGGS